MICLGATFGTLAAQRDMTFWTELLAQILRECLRRIWLGSVVGAVFVWLLLTSSAWKAASIAMAHADMAASAWVASVVRRPPPTEVITVGIGTDAYQTEFGGQSPLDRHVLARHVQSLLAALPSRTLLVVDLDVSPSLNIPSEQGDALDRLWVANAGRVVLSQPVLNPGSATSEWQRRLEHQGVVFGSPAIERSFGLLDPGHDYAGSLSEVAVQRLHAEGAKGNLKPPKSSNRSALTPALLAAPVVLPLGGFDLATLSALQPRAVVFGGMWPGADIFDTPFGPRNGAVVHAAKLAGYLNARHTLPSLVQVLAAIIAAAICVTVARRAARRLVPAGGLPANDPLTQFARGQLRRLCVVAVVLLCLVALLLVTALLRHLGWGLSSLMPLGFSLLSVVGAWVSDITRDLQDTPPPLAPAIKSNWKAEFWAPVRAAFSAPAPGAPAGWRRTLLLLAFVTGRMLLPLGAIIYLSTR